MNRIVLLCAGSIRVPGGNLQNKSEKSHEESALTSFFAFTESREMMAIYTERELRETRDHCYIQSMRKKTVAICKSASSGCAHCRCNFASIWRNRANTPPEGQSTTARISISLVKTNNYSTVSQLGLSRFREYCIACGIRVYVGTFLTKLKLKNYIRDIVFHGRMNCIVLLEVLEIFETIESARINRNNRNNII